MKTETYKGTIENAFGSPLPSPVSFSGSFEAYESVAEAEAAKDGLNEKELLAAINNKLKANARAKSMTEALKNAGYEKPEADNPQVILKAMIKNLILAKKSPAEAQSLAETLLGYTLETV